MYFDGNGLGLNANPIIFIFHQQKSSNEVLHVFRLEIAL